MGNSHSPNGQHAPTAPGGFAPTGSVAASAPSAVAQAAGFRRFSPTGANIDQNRFEEAFSTTLKEMGLDAPPAGSPLARGLFAAFADANGTVSEAEFLNAARVISVGDHASKAAVTLHAMEGNRHARATSSENVAGYFQRSFDLAAAKLEGDVVDLEGYPSPAELKPALEAGRKALRCEVCADLAAAGAELNVAGGVSAAVLAEFCRKSRTIFFEVGSRQVSLFTTVGDLGDSAVASAYPTLS